LVIFFLWLILFFERIFNKFFNIKIDPQNGFVLLFDGCISSIPFNRLFIYSSNFFAIKKMIYIHMFFKRNYSIGFVIRNQSFFCLSFWIYLNDWIMITKCHTLFVCSPNELHYHSHNKNSNIKKFFHVASSVFLSMHFFQFSFHIFHYHFMD
jgi:hypothetical protein